MTTTIDLPIRFYDDHVARDLPGGREISRTKRLVRVELTDAERDEMMSDADHYSTCAEWGPEYLGLQTSARAALARLILGPRS